ncbi:TPA: phage tail assembly chaperone [Stenotrophomonas maltophilia]|nr:phage tail assembly chaperone [Stenotrophomonas maltophilia]
MTDEMYAISDFGYRIVTISMALAPGETRVSIPPEGLLTRVKADQVRNERSQRLRSTDWTQMDDAPLTAAKKLEWGAYRQLLRDLPSVAGFPNVPWPQPPANTDGAADGVPGQSQPIAG